MTETDQDILAGITRRTTKGELSLRLERASTIIQRLRGRELKRTAAIESRVKEKWANQTANANADLLQILAQGTEEELKVSSEFLHDLEEVLPPFLQRLHQGVMALVKEDDGADG
jgi:hypothetical protein